MKMLRSALCMLALFAVVGAALAQFPAGFPPGVFLSRGAIDAASTPAYSGPGDLVSGAEAWYGLRAYNAAYATGSNNAINIRCGSGAQLGNTFNITILTTGALNIAGALADCGAHATCTSGTASGTTALVLVGCSATPTAGDTFIGTISTGSLVQPVYAVSVGTFTGGAGTVTLNTAQTVSLSAVTVQSSMFVTEAYDQTGNGNNVTQSATSQQPQLLPVCLNGLPCILSIGPSEYLTSFTISAVLPITFSTVSFRNGTTPSTQYLGLFNGGVNGLTLAYVNTNTVEIRNSTVFTGSVADSAWHSLSGIVAASGAATLDIDGTITTGTVGTQAPSGTLFIWFNTVSDANLLSGETGIWPSTISNTNLGLLCHNQFTYWGTSVSC